MGKVAMPEGMKGTTLSIDAYQWGWYRYPILKLIRFSFFLDSEAKHT
jgi:hypothetical protein